MTPKLLQNAFARSPQKTKTRLAELLGVPNSAISELVAGRRAIKANEIPLIVRYLELDRVPVLGRVGRAGLIEAVGNGGEPETVRLPFPAPDELIAFEVAEGAMAPRYDGGDVIVCWLRQRRPLESFYGEEAVVDTRDGRRFLRHVLAGHRAGLVTLHGLDPRAVIENARPVWIGEIYLTVRAAQRQQLDDSARGRSRARRPSATKGR